MQQDEFYPDVVSDEIEELTARELLSEETIMQYIFNVYDKAEQAANEGLLKARARQLRILGEFKAFLNACRYKAVKLNGIGGNRTEFDNQPISLSCGEWICDMSGVKRAFKASRGEVEIRFASPIPILITAVLENIDENTEKLCLAYFKNGWRNLVCGRSTAASSTKIIELADYGLEVNSENAKLLVRFLADLVMLNFDKIPRLKAAARMGWCDNNEFMPYANIKFDGENEFKHLYEALKPVGDFEAWVSYTADLRKNKYLKLQMAASFAAPIIERVNASCFILHFWGGTETGKTVGMMVAASVWGNPLLGKYVYSLNNTQNTVMSIAAFLNNLPVCCDELQTVKSRKGYDSLVMQCTEGIGRGRMKYDRVQRLQTWKTAFIFTGEEPLTNDNSGGGTKNRVIEFECREKIVEDGNSVVRFISENYGLAGKKYINLIKKENLKKRYSEIFNRLISSCDTSDKQAMAMACLLLGDEMACKYIYTNEKPFELEEVKEFLKTKSEVDNSERAYEFVLNMVSANVNRFEENGGLEVWGRIGDSFVMINKNILVREMSENGFSFDSVKSKWANKGYLIRANSGKLIHQTKCFGIKASYIKISLLKEDFYEEEEAPF